MRAIRVTLLTFVLIAGIYAEYYLGKQGESCAAACNRLGMNCNPVKKMILFLQFTLLNLCSTLLPMIRTPCSQNWACRANQHVGIFRGGQSTNLVMFLILLLSIMETVKVSKHNACKW